ncbi:RNA polymerase subunit sigma [Saccharibacillus kuerlensis]|uniref:RNA polymerase sigma factor n=2 Tax=Saccharibacillus kuerlensis TaxID=459527 RepID=A0ABQ2L5L4_9BACL|nr:RNA polymerase subunit sigma [Saccharibacillus kuerlensis]
MENLLFMQRLPLYTHPIRKGGHHLELIERIKAKEENALRELMEQYGDLLLRTACLLVRDRQTAEEVVQDAFVQAYNKIDQLDDPSKLRPWLIRIAVNGCRMRQRTWSWRHIFPGGGAGELPLDADSFSTGADEDFITQWKKEHLAAAVRSLDYRYRESIVLYYFDELNVREIAELLETNENTIKSRLSRGRTLLKKTIEEEERL